MIPSAASPTSPPVLERAHRFDALCDPWRALADAARNLFATWEWQSTWWRHFGAGEPQLWTCRDSEGLRAVLPLLRDEVGLRFAGHKQGDRLGPVARPEDLQWSAGALAALLAEEGIERFRGDDLPAEVDWTVLGEVREVLRRPSPVVSLAGLDWPGFLESRGRNLRRLTRQCERLLARPDVSVHETTDAATLTHDLRTLFALHDLRWPDRRSDFSHRSRAFHEDFATVALERGWLRMRRLEIEGRPAAALISFRFAEAEWFYQGGRDPAFDAERPGWALHLHALRAALDDRLIAYRMLRGGEEYKSRLADGDEPVVSIEARRPAR